MVSLKLQGWICLACERPFTRRWNANRHATEQHPGQLFQIVSMVEYLAGRQSGIYKPQFQTQSSSATLSARKNATQIEDIFRIFESNEKGKQEGNSQARVMTEEFAREVARQAASYCISTAQQQSQAAFISKMHPMFRQSPFLSNILISTGNTGDIFGYRFHICSNCLIMQHLAVLYPPSQQYGAIIEDKHWCDKSIIARNQNLGENEKQIRTKIMHEYLPKYLKNIVNAWSGRNASIARIKLSSNLSTRASPNDQIKILHPKDPQRSVTLHYSKEKHLELQPNVGVNNPDHWSVRVLRDGRADLADNELQEFLDLVKNATFGIFNIYTQKTDRNHEFQKPNLSGTQIQDSLTRCYFMYLVRNE